MKIPGALKIMYTNAKQRAQKSEIQKKSTFAFTAQISSILF